MMGLREKWKWQKSWGEQAEVKGRQIQNKTTRRQQMWHQIFSDVENAEIVAQISHVTNGVVRREQNEWTLTCSKKTYTPLKLLHLFQRSLNCAHNKHTRAHTAEGLHGSLCLEIGLYVRVCVFSLTQHSGKLSLFITMQTWVSTEVSKIRGDHTVWCLSWAIKHTMYKNEVRDEKCSVGDRFHG